MNMQIFYDISTSSTKNTELINVSIVVTHYYNKLNIGG